LPGPRKPRPEKGLHRAATGLRAIGWVTPEAQAGL
jgi:hypothetical protein